MGIYGMLLTILFFSVILGLLLLYFRKKRLEEENYHLVVQQQLLEAHYDAVREQIEWERRFLHDIKNHLETMEYLLSCPDGQQEISRQYEQEIKRLGRDFGICEWTDNAVVNVALYNKFRQCEREGIEVQADIYADSLIEFDEWTILTILYNLFDNAMEANRHLRDGKKKYLNLSMIQKGQELFLRFENPRERTYGPKSGQRTSKKDQVNHGLGIQILKETVQRQRGSIQILQGEEEFVVEICLKNGRQIDRGRKTWEK